MDAFATLEPGRLLAVGFHVLPTLIWVILASSYWRSHGTGRPQGQLLRLFRLLSGLIALHYGVNIVIDLTYPTRGESGGTLWAVACVVAKATTLAELAVLRHLIPLATLGGSPPGRLWLTANYGFALLAGAASIALEALSDSGHSLVSLYLVIMTLAIVVDVVRLARSRGGRWRPVMMVDLGSSGFVILALTLFVGVVAIVVIEQSRFGAHLAWAVIHSLVGLALAAVFALRIFREVVRRFLVGLARITAAAGILLGARMLAPVASEPRQALLVDGAAVFVLLLALGPGSDGLRRAVGRWVLRQSQRREQELQLFLRTLEPELGVEEACQQAVREVARVLKLQGAGLLLTSSGPQIAQASHLITHGRIDLKPVAAAWPTDLAAEQLPKRAFDLLWLRDVALQEALHDASITWIVPVEGQQRSWGHLFVCAGPFGIAAGSAKLEILESFARQLALVLDSADLLARALTVERELAQAAKLAAVGEMAARMAHEIRNPVTAARSLAQMLAREPNSPANAEHAGLMVRELDRVEHQVRSLLDFARRETYRFETVRLADLVRATVGDFRLDVDGEPIELDLELDPEVEVRADPERMRQVLINLVENAVDALREAAGRRRLTLSVVHDQGFAKLEVRDSGPGVEEDLLPRLFEPFVSGKTQGTGLGLAIARRIVEAHDGQIEGEPGPQNGPHCGMIFRVSLPRLAAAVPVETGANLLERAV